jgi:hypothetical protein
MLVVVDEVGAYSGVGLSRMSGDRIGIHGSQVGNLVKSDQLCPNPKHMDLNLSNEHHEAGRP